MLVKKANKQINCPGSCQYWLALMPASEVILKVPATFSEVITACWYYWNMLTNDQVQLYSLSLQKISSLVTFLSSYLLSVVTLELTRYTETFLMLGLVLICLWMKILKAWLLIPNEICWAVLFCDAVHYALISWFYLVSLWMKSLSVTI